MAKLTNDDVERLLREAREAQAAGTPLPTPGTPRSFGAERYQVIGLVGTGGMGDVYKAYDPQLKRHVALKVLRGGSPEWAQRLVQEAQAQARVEHEHVCKVYGVGEADGRPFIALQFIDGKTLRAVARQMTLEERVQVMKQVCEALHAAHRIGLIHRDVKPANIMVERGADGEWKPFVTDFGLAREVDAAGATLTGIAIGTPHYMAPEQASADHERLDRRTDVYGLGATLYEILVGRTPFEGTATVEVILQVVGRDPTPPRQHDPSLPADLETIILRCLEKEPQRRYETARALAEDLQRYLDGEPILARPTSRMYRLAKAARKHRALVALAAVAVAAVVVGAGVGLAARRSAGERARLAQEFGQSVERIEAIMRYSAMLPLHDTRREKALVRARMAAIEGELARLGPVAAGPGHYALGRGHLALRDPARAREHLEAALAAGYRAPQVGYALGLALGRLYKDALDEAQRSGTPAQRSARERELEQTLRDPALRQLADSLAGGAADAAPEYAAGLIAFYQKRYDEALAQAERALERVPWLYEALALEGEVYTTRGFAYVEVGKYDQAEADYARGGAAFAAAMQIEHSDPTVYLSECARWMNVLSLQLARGGTPEAPFARLLATCDQALAADPESASALDQEGEGHWRVGDYLIERGQDPRAHTARAIALAEAALRLSPNLVSAHENLGLAYQSLGEYQATRGIDPRPAYARAIERNLQVVALNPNYFGAWNHTGLAYWEIGQYEGQHGIDPRPSLRRAVETLERAVQLSPADHRAYLNLGNAQGELATVAARRGGDPLPDFERTFISYRRGISLNPSNDAGYVNLCDALGALADYQRRSGADPAATAAAALVECRRAQALDDGSFSHYASANAHRVLAAHQRAGGADPSAELERARHELVVGLGFNPNDTSSFAVRAEVELEAARWARAHGSPTAPALAAAAAALAHAAAINPADAETWRAQAEVRRLRGEPAAALEAAARALAIDPQLARAHAIAAAAARELGRADAAASCRTALALDPLLARELGPDCSR